MSSVDVVDSKNFRQLFKWSRWKSRRNASVDSALVRYKTLGSLKLLQLLLNNLPT
jgi:hypothetical protein